MGAVNSYIYPASYLSWQTSWQTFRQTFQQASRLYYATNPGIPETQDSSQKNTLFFDWVPDWEDVRDYKLTNFMNYLKSQKMITSITVNDKKADLSISAYLDTRKTDLTKQHDGAAREVAYAAAITYSSPDHVLIPIHVNYKLLYTKTINRILNTNVDAGSQYPVPIREVLKTLYQHGLENVISRCKLIFYNLEHSLDGIRISLINGYPVVFGFVVSPEIILASVVCSPGASVGGTMVGCIVGFSENTFKIHVSDRRLFCKDKNESEFHPFLYLTETYLQSNMCNDFYSIVGIHEPSDFQLLVVQPTASIDDPI